MGDENGSGILFVTYQVGNKVEGLVAAPVGEVLRQWDPAPTLHGAVWWSALTLEPQTGFGSSARTEAHGGHGTSDECVSVFILPLSARATIQKQL